MGKLFINRKILLYFICLRKILLRDDYLYN